MSVDEMIEQLRQFPTGFVTDAFSRLDLAGWSEKVYPISRTARKLVGRAVTIQYQPKRGDGDKLPSHYQVIAQIAQPGDVLVIAAGGTPCWLMGENQTHWAMNHRLAGVLVDGCVRDADEIAELAMPVFARGAGTRPYSTELEMAAINVPVEFAGMQVHPGDIVCGDGDGLVTIPAERLAEVMCQVLDIAELEKDMEAAIQRCVSLEELQVLNKKKKICKEC